MAGIAALMRSRKERDRRRQESSSQSIEETGLAEVISGNYGGSTTLTRSQTSLTQSLNHKGGGGTLPQGSTTNNTCTGRPPPPPPGPGPITKYKPPKGQEWSRSRSVSSRKFDHLLKKGSSLDQVKKDHSTCEVFLDSGLQESYTSVYIGLVLMAIGLVITSVGLGEKGFKTTELKLIGPTLGLIGLCCVILKILKCTFPKLFQRPKWVKFRKSKLSPVDKSSAVQTPHAKNGHFGPKGGVPTLVTPPYEEFPISPQPRITLENNPSSAAVTSSDESQKRPSLPIPNFIGESKWEESSYDDDDFDPGRSRPPSHRGSSPEEEGDDDEVDRPRPPNPDLDLNPQPPRPSTNQEDHEVLLLNPKTLIL